MDTALLLKAYQPATRWSERGCYYRQWRLLPYESSPKEGEERDPVPYGTTLQSFEVQDLLGEGNYSQVLHAQLRSTRQGIALKIIEKAKLKRYKKEDEVRCEKWVLTKLRHPSMVRLYASFQDQSALYLALELLPGGELWAMAHKQGVRPSLAAFYTAQMLEVLQHLHDNGVVHRDVKPENVLLTADRYIKVIDFGTAKLLRTSDRHAAAIGETGTDLRAGKFKEFVGTPEYMSPEAINNKDADHRADLWSLGCFVYMLLTGQPAFKGGSDYLTFKRTLARKFRFPEGMPAAPADLIDRLLVLDPKGRLGGREGETHEALRQHEWFSEACRLPNLHSVPLPIATVQEMTIVEAATEAQTLAKMFPKAPDEWSTSLREAIIFELGKRAPPMDQPTRDFFDLGPPLEPIKDDLEEFEQAASDATDHDPNRVEDETDAPAANGEDGTVV